MAITQVGTVTTATAATAGTVTVSKPTGVQADDFMVAVLVQNEQVVTYAPTGFSHYKQGRSSTAGITGNTFSAHTFYKVAGGSEPSSYTMTVPTTGAPMVLVLIALRGVDTGNPFNADALQVYGTQDDTGNGPRGPALDTTGLIHRIAWRAARRASASGSNPSFSTTTTGWGLSGQAAVFSGGTARYAVGLFSRTVTPVAGGTAQFAPEGLATPGDETDNIWHHIALNVAPTLVPAPKANITANAYGLPPTMTFTVTRPQSTATAYNPLTGPGAVPPSAPVTATAYNPMGWVIHPVTQGAIAFNARIVATANASRATVSVTLGGGIAYYGAHESRRWRIPPEDRSWPVNRESRSWGIPPDRETNRVWKIPPKDDTYARPVPQ